MSGRRLRIFGHVQGVFFRAWALQQAQMLGLKGWVRNRRDGSVEIEAHGEPAALDTFAEKCRTGSSQARVERMSVEEIESDAPPGFRAAPTL